MALELSKNPKSRNVIRYGIAFLASVLLVFVVASCLPKQTRGGEPLLLLNDEAPLLLDDEEGAGGPVADNSRCFVCHLNYMREDIAVVHASAGIGCQGCHGESSPHIADESWAEGGNGTAPDIMYAREKVNPACMACHPKEKIDTAVHKAVLSATAEKIYCTDCHGTHRLEERKLKWK